MRKFITAAMAVATLAIVGVLTSQAQDRPHAATGPAAHSRASTGSQSAQPRPATSAPRNAGECVIQPATLEVSATQRIDYELGTLYVPENRADPRSRVIGVGFVRLKADTPTNAPPTFHLPGGPGGSFLTGLKSALPRLQRYRAVGDVVVMDQRGFSQRGDVLRYSYRTADEPLDQPASLARHTAAFTQVARDAVAQFTQKGIDLRGYTVKECAQDVNDLRQALGYETISLVATSFGSQWSFATMRLHPEIVARAILSGVEPLDFGYDMPSQILGSMQRYWTEAQQDKALQPYMPAGGLEVVLKEILSRFEPEPLRVPVKDPKGGQMVTVTLGKEDFQRDLAHRASDGPAWVLAVYHQHYEAWAAAVLAKRRSHEGDLRLIGPLIDTSLGVTPNRQRQLRSDPGTEFLGQWNWDAYIATAGIWPTADVGDDFRTPVPTPIPIIFVQGDWDTSTPMENAMEIVKSFPHGRVLIVERGEHAGIEPLAQSVPKVWGQLLDFLRTGNMPNLPQRVTVPRPKFIVPDFPKPHATSIIPAGARTVSGATPGRSASPAGSSWVQGGNAGTIP